MKIVSLLPSATEIVCALGLGGELVAVTHECDFPAEAVGKPVITRSRLPAGLSSAEIDAAVRAQMADSNSLYTVDRALLHALRPDLILTQQLCAVCAVSYDDVQAAVVSLPLPRPQLLNLEPVTLDDVLGDILAVGRATDRSERACQVVGDLRGRVEAVREVVSSAGSRPRVALLEWLDPLFCAGHWNPELVEIAGGRDGFGRKHKSSAQVSWEAVRDFAPEIIIVAQCGFSAERSWEDLPGLAARPGFGDLPAARTGRVFVVDGSAYFNRPGPRLVDSLELLAAVIHPDLFPGNDLHFSGVMSYNTGRSPRTCTPRHSDV